MVLYVKTEKNQKELFWSSSGVERSTVNRKVAGANPASRDLLD